MMDEFAPSNLMAALENHSGLVGKCLIQELDEQSPQLCRYHFFLTGFDNLSLFFMLRRVLTSAIELKSATIGSSGAPTRHPLFVVFVPLGTVGCFTIHVWFHVPHSESCLRHARSSWQGGDHHGHVPEKRGD
jgi:hypothetical protein